MKTKFSLVLASLALASTAGFGSSSTADQQNQSTGLNGAQTIQSQQYQNQQYQNQQYQNQQYQSHRHHGENHHHWRNFLSMGAATQMSNCGDFDLLVYGPALCGYDK